MLLDLRKSANFSMPHIKKLAEIEKNSRIVFNKYIEQLCENNEINTYSYFLKTTNRNTFISSLYSDFCKVSLIEDLLKTEPPLTEIIVDSKGMLSAARSVIKKYSANCTVIYKRNNPVNTF